MLLVGLGAAAWWALSRGFLHVPARLEERPDVGEFHNRIKLRLHLAHAHAEDRPIQINIFPTRKFRMKTGTDFEERGNPAMKRDFAFGRWGDTGKDFQ